MKYFAYVIAAIFILLGAAIIAGYFISGNYPAEFRIIIGIVLILYGIFRIVTTYFKKNDSKYIE
jgi:prolipoprotein diacylglyceryltransferase